MPATPSIAETVYSQFTRLPSHADRVAFLQKYCDEGQTETDWVDFKQGEFIKDAKEPWIEKTLSKFLSAFGNSGGGLLVFGVHADEDPKTKKDCCRKLSRVPNPGELATRLDRLHHTITNPPVPGVKFYDFVDPNAPLAGSGFVIVYMPDSHHKPHRAAFDEHYYLRFGGHCRRPTPEILRRLFFPQKSVRMGVSVHGYCPHPDVMASVSIINKGTSTAHDVYITAEWDFPWQSNQGGTSTFTWNHATPKGVNSFESKRPLHPTSQTDFLKISTRIGAMPPEGAKFHLRVTVYVRDSEPQQFKLMAHINDFISGFEKEATPIVETPPQE